MARNLFLVLLVFAIALSLTHSLNNTFAESASEESHEHEPKDTAAGSTGDTNIDKQELMVQEEDASHESAGVGGDAHEHEAVEEPQHAHIHETKGGSHVHNSATAEAAQWVGVGTLSAAASIFGIKLRAKNNFANYRLVVLTLVTGAGVIHLLVVPDHLADVSIEHAKFFTAAGVAQISFGILFMIKPTKRFAIIGIVGNIGSIILYLVTRIGNLPAPFGAPEGIDTVGILAKIVEISLVSLLIYLAIYYKKIKPVEVSRT